MLPSIVGSSEGTSIVVWISLIVVCVRVEYWVIYRYNNLSRTYPNSIAYMFLGGLLSFCCIRLHVHYTSMHLLLLCHAIKPNLLILQIKLCWCVLHWNIKWVGLWSVLCCQHPVPSHSSLFSLPKLPGRCSGFTEISLLTFLVTEFCFPYK